MNDQERLDFYEKMIDDMDERIDNLVDALFRIYNIQPEPGCSRADLSLALGEAHKIAYRNFILRGRVIPRNDEAKALAHEAATNSH